MIEIETMQQDIAIELPQGWRLVRLGEVCKQDRQIIDPGTADAAERPYLSLEHIESNSGRIIKQSSQKVEDEGRSTTFAFETRHVLYGKLRPYLNKVALPDFTGRCTTELIPLLPTNAISREFLAWILRRKETVTAAMREKTGSRMPRADMDELLALHIPLPPLAEQQRIAAILNEQMAAVERARAAAEAQLEAAKSLPAAYLRAVFDSDEAQAWPRVKLSEVCAFCSGGTPSKAQESLWQGDVPWVSPKDMKTDKINDATNHVSLRAIQRSATRLVPAGTVLCVTRSGILAHTFPVALAMRSLTFNQDIRALVPIDSKIDSNYLLSALKGAETVVVQEGVKKGSTVHSIRSGFLENLTIPLPALVEQRRVVKMLNEQMAGIDQARTALEAQLDAITQLPAALLRRAFSGELTKRHTVIQVQPQQDLFKRSQQDLFRLGSVVSYIIANLPPDSSFGRLQLAKTLYLGEVLLGIPLNGRYQRATYGPFDPAIYELEDLAREQRWFRKDEHSYPVTYKADTMTRSRLPQAEHVLGDLRLALDNLVKLVVTIGTRRAEAIATLFAAWNDFLLDGTSPTDDQIVREVRENWHASKEKFSPNKLHEELAWMRANNLVPHGTGPHTEVINAK
jgi:type I restriction enzyme S subunit